MVRLLKVRFLLTLAALLLIGVSPAGAMTSNDNNGGNTSNTCPNNNSYPPPYTGGAGVAKFFHLADGSTVTITTSGAVIKQSPCQSAYREGWINVSDICSTSSEQALKGHLSAGISNPNGSANFNGCSSTTTQSSAPGPSSLASPAPVLTQSQSQTVNVTPAAASTSTTQTQTSTPAAKALPNTGAGNILGFAGITSVISAIGHYAYQTRFKKHLL